MTIKEKGPSREDLEGGRERERSLFLHKADWNLLLQKVSCGSTLDLGHKNQVVLFILEPVRMIDLRPSLITEEGSWKTADILCKSFRNVLPARFSGTLSVSGVQKHGLFL